MSKTRKVNGRRAKPGLDLRLLLLRQIRKIGLTPNAVSLRQRAVHPASVRAYLRGDRDTSGRVIGELMTIVGLEVVESDGT